jgi:arylsulfatase A-like enzyme
MVSTFLKIIFLCFIVNISLAQNKAISAFSKPNIIIILADDMGYSDLGCYGGEIETPNLDWLANKGMRFTSFYNASRCCPTRASLLTGLYQHEAGVGNMTRNQFEAGYRGHLTPNSVTIAEVLKGVGYQTGMVGKWHISETKALPSEETQLKWLSHQITDLDFSDTLSYPTHKGFDKYYGNIWGVADYFDPFSLVNGTKPVKTVPKDFYYTNVIGDSTASYINQFSKKEQPFFIYTAFTAPHWPIQDLTKDIEKYQDTYRKGWQYIRRQRYVKMVKLGLVNPKEVKLSEFMYPEKNWSTNPDTAWDARAMAVHAAMVDCLDQNVGKLIKALKTSGELENTLIMFLSDNGASAERPETLEPGFDRAGTTRDGEKIIFSADKKVLPGSQTTMAGIGPQWANVSCTPFRYWKSKEHEGGISTPFIAFWPRMITQENAVINSSSHIIDLMPTCVELSGAIYPKMYNGYQISKEEGISLIPIFKGEKNELGRELFWEHNGAAALRTGDWKIVRVSAKDNWELYDLKHDRSEINNLNKKYPERVKEMVEKWEQFANSHQVFPKPKN